jgi:hypothetical protein
MKKIPSLRLIFFGKTRLRIQSDKNAFNNPYHPALPSANGLQYESNLNSFLNPTGVFVAFF